MFLGRGTKRFLTGRVDGWCRSLPSGPSRSPSLLRFPPVSDWGTVGRGLAWSLRPSTLFLFSFSFLLVSPRDVSRMSLPAGNARCRSACSVDLTCPLPIKYLRGCLHDTGTSFIPVRNLISYRVYMGVILQEWHEVSCEPLFLQAILERCCLSTALATMWSEFACSANQHPKSTVKKIKPISLCAPNEFLQKRICHVW